MIKLNFIASPSAIIQSIRENIKIVKKLVGEALQALRDYDLDIAEVKVSEAVKYLDRAFLLIEELEAHTRTRVQSRE